MEKKRIYLVGNAHLDPVWQWRWQEGSAEAKATIRSALDRMKEFPEFRFVCSSASVYRWVEEFAPEMFEEIKQRVAEGRFIVVGGWHVQPDCNLPSGEAFARQSLYSQRWFAEKLGTTARVGYNVDSFGHNCMLPQILKKSGMDSYIWMRPGHHEKDIPHDLFTWESPDGSQVTAYRIEEPYCFNFNTLEELENRLARLDEVSRTETNRLPFFYGVGNHGGGPTVRNLELLRELKAKHPELELGYSDLHDFFEDVRADGSLPVYREDLQHHAAGCYSTVSRVKQGIRRAEHELSAAESLNMLAGLLCGKKPENRRLEEAWLNVCFCHFHDSMDGCSIREVYDDADLMLGQARNTAQVIENNACQTVSWQIETEKRELIPDRSAVPVVIFNPHGFEAEQLVQINRQYSRVFDSDGREISSQLVRSSTVECTWRRDTLFSAKVPALGYAVYYLSNGESTLGGSDVRAESFGGVRSANEHGGTVLENENYRIRFELYSGYISSFIDKKTGRELISARSAVPVVIDEYYHDTWSHAKNFFTDEMARFSDAEVSVIESGPVRATVKVVSRYNSSTLTEYFSLAAGSDKLEVRAVADWHEKHKMLKLAWHMAVEEPKAYYEIPFGVIERPADGEEEPGQSFTAVRGRDSGWAVVNNGAYSSSVKGGTIYQTMLRSPIYGDHGGPRDSESEYTEQGRVELSYILVPIGESFARLAKEGRLLNRPLTNIVETWHAGRLSDKPYSALEIDRDNVMLTAVKRSEDGDGMIVRLCETAGLETEFTVSGELLAKPIKDRLTPWTVKTYRLDSTAEDWREVLLTEYELS